MGSPPEKIKDGRNALIISVAIVLFLVGSNYIYTTYGRLGESLGGIGDSFEKIGLYLAIPPAILLVILSGIGIEIPSFFVESDVWLWIYCVLFYTLFIYFMIRASKKIMRHNRYPEKAKQQQAS